MNSIGCCTKPHLQKTFRRKLVINKPFAKPYTSPIKHHVVSCKANAHDIETISYFVGKGITLFTMFYCTLNWLHYRSQRKQQENIDKDN